MVWVNLALWLILLNGVCSSSPDVWTIGKINNPDPYRIFQFSTLSTDPRRDYLEVIRGIRNTLADNELEPAYGIPRLSPRGSVPMSRRFLLVELTNFNENTITLALDTSRLYLVGFRRGNQFRYFPDTAQDVDTLFPDIPQEDRAQLPFDSSYGALAQEAGHRRLIPLGLAHLDQAIQQIQDDRRLSLARALTIIIQMIPEAVRFRYIEDFVGNLMRREAEAVPSETMLDLENEWGSLSSRIQNSVGGTLDPAVVITDRLGRQNRLSTLTTGLALNIGILFFVCNRPPNVNQLPPTKLHVDGGSNFTNISQPITIITSHGAAAGGICNKIREPTVRIVGRDGLCAAVKGDYKDGNPIILSPCESNEEVNQLWTLKADGTIRSNGSCLTTYGYSPGDYIMIFDCTTAVVDATKWEIWPNGTIINPRSSLVLTAWSGRIGSELTAELNLYATRQAWVAANNTQPIVTPIMNIGEFGMCLFANSINYNMLSCIGCQSGESRQMFAIYPDGTIRPNDRRNLCLAAPRMILLNSVSNEFCNGGPEQHWSINRDNTISNLYDGRIMHASFRMPTNPRIVVSLVSLWLTPNEEWQAWLL